MEESKKDNEINYQDLVKGIFNSPAINMYMADKYTKTIEKLEEENAQLKKELQDKESYADYLDGKVTGMEYAIEHFCKKGD